MIKTFADFSEDTNYKRCTHVVKKNTLPAKLK